MQNNNNNCESSETIRKAPYFNFEDFYKYGHAKHVPHIEESFLEWFIGFFEGDGYLGFSKNHVYNRLINKKKYKKSVCERLKLSICQKERRVIEMIAFKFGFGSISSFKQNKTIYWQWNLENKVSIERIAFLLSGNLIIKERQKQFLKWVEVGEKKNMFQFPFNKNKLYYSSISLDNCWLVGFIDSEGYFYANLIIKNDIKKKINILPKMKKKMVK